MRIEVKDTGNTSLARPSTGIEVGVYPVSRIEPCYVWVEYKPYKVLVCLAKVRPVRTKEHANDLFDDAQGEDMKGIVTNSVSLLKTNILC